MKQSKNKYYETDHFRSLNKEWRSKLKASGFDDIEDSATEYGPLEKTINIRTNKFKGREQLEEYFDIASQYLHDGQFKNELERSVWELHATGYSLSEITNRLKLSVRSKAQHIINRVKKRMKLR